jgi:hypothetical protein
MHKSHQEGEEMSVTFPGESAEYRQARNRLLDREIELRRMTEAVAAARRELPPGGRSENYVFHENGADGTPTERSERASALPCISRPPARSDLRKAEERRHRALRLVARGEPEFLAGFGEPGQRKRRDSKVPGVHRSYRVLAHESERCVFDLILRWAEHRDRSVWREVRVQQQKQPSGVAPA